ncbi:flippase-like domain-containing protein [Methanocaldococcus indicus]|uniref:flippase-like domain-containing protein n=1 Tax=Methanocaldococcus indicus TaxID=213231 RepID=UPI003C6DB439
MIKKYLLNKRTVISFVVSFIIISYIFLKINLDELILVLRNTNIFYYIIAFFMFYISILIKSYRWKIMLENIDISIKLIDSFKIYFLSMFVNSLVPAKLGDVYRGYLLKKKTNKSISLGFGTVFIERILDLITMITLLFFSAYFSFKSDIPKDILLSIKWGCIFILILIFSIILFILFNKKIKIKRFDISNILINFEKGLRVIDLQSLPTVLFLSYIGWIVEGLTVYFVFLSLKINLGLLFSIFSDLASSLLTAVPITPSGLGIVEYALIYILNLKNLDYSLAFAVLILYRGITYFSIILFGSVIYLIESIKK